MKTFYRASLLYACLVLISGCAGTQESPRSTGMLIDDNVLEVMIEREIRGADESFKGSHIVVAVFDGIVLLLGQVATNQLREQATTATENMYKVDPAKVHNHLTVSGPISMLARTNDGWLTTKVKTRLLASDQVKGLRIKVISENGIVYLMGAVTQEQADAAVAVAQRAFGVQKIVKVFTYTDLQS
ncbi:MAG: BON domain-containing protein [Gammaproteobacteria bacterium TMED92]|nr:MAG: BON domain-containing protein [Gammaproteobacteria bacterium TMED92]